MAKFSKLVLLLSSSHDGEVVASAKAIGRKLAREGKDWHWLARQVDGLAQPEPQPQPRPDPQGYGPGPHEWATQARAQAQKEGFWEAMKEFNEAMQRETRAQREFDEALRRPHPDRPTHEYRRGKYR